MNHQVLEQVLWLLHEFRVEPNSTGAVIAARPLGFHPLDHSRITGYSKSRNRAASGSRAYLHLPSSSGARSVRSLSASPFSAVVPVSADAGFIARAIFRTASCRAGYSILNMAISTRFSTSRNDPTPESGSDVSAPDGAMARRPLSETPLAAASVLLRPALPTPGPTVPPSSVLRLNDLSHA